MKVGTTWFRNKNVIYPSWCSDEHLSNTFYHSLTTFSKLEKIVSHLFPGSFSHLLPSCNPLGHHTTISGKCRGCCDIETGHLHNALHSLSTEEYSKKIHVNTVIHVTINKHIYYTVHIFVQGYKLVPGSSLSKTVSAAFKYTDKYSYFTFNVCMTS